MKISKNGVYALHAMVYLTRHQTAQPVPAGTIARAEGVPPGTLARVLGRLRRAGLITWHRRPQQGWALARAPEAISLRQILEATEDLNRLLDCPLKHFPCKSTPQDCRLYGRWLPLAEAWLAVLAETSLSEVAWSHPEHRLQTPPLPAG